MAHPTEVGVVLNPYYKGTKYGLSHMSKGLCTVTQLTTRLHGTTVYMNVDMNKFRQYSYWVVATI